MDILANLAGLMHGLSIAFEPANLMYCLIGCLLGTLIGVLPGLGPLNAVAMLLPISFYMTPDAALIMLASIYYGAQYGGSTASILVNMPGETSSIVTCLDGHQMARQGRAGPALAVAALGSAFAGIVSTLFVALFAPPLANLALLFGPAEYVSLMVLGLIVAVVLTHGSVLVALGMLALGLLLGSVGTDVVSGAYRMTLGIPQLADGIGIVPLAMGLFGMGEIIKNLESKERQIAVEERIGRLWPSREDFRSSWRAVLRGTGLGSLLGLLPGGGAMLASFAAYALEKKLSLNPSRFGRGAVEGVAAPESANNAGAQTSFIPLLTLGIPSNAVIALLSGAMMIQGITPGPNIIQEQPNLFWGLIASMIVGNAMLLIINLPLVGIWVQLLKVPYHLFYPMMLVFMCIGVYTINTSGFDVFLLVVFGLIGYAFIKWRCEPAPLILAFVLEPIIEQNFKRALQVSYGDPAIFISRPISLALLLIGAVFLVMLLLPAIRRTRDASLQE
ncbi:tripartite tricarboxylate transporter permease [Microvirga tunisiensis]|uniref:Tripartite tricarboxylate transporter permease n=1 Tax=Microvirga tunisiensis TaxID=2108360 RepID=A0A5N7MG68_9HYPH|nr:tripartite tricarboxylate transporter permease [Microvirga tunisiensis]MPR08676.1 tripartite tricarboxylate transporter permease [Microvirga tunisiensis]MPR25965.1 tripartite tricarboxylate transporter permease [Microvirga tunisiensis]